MPTIGTFRNSLLVGLATVALAGAVAGEASAAVEQPSKPASPAEACGYLGGGEYRHCDAGTGSTVMLDVQDLWGSIYHYCVGPGTTNIQPVIRWRIRDAWWNGRVGCQPGYYGPA
ncbi:MAG TPA: DUF6355 family natural product biosynthesis protein [Pseudonocardia sp.]|jgi:hypothetical protein